MVLLGVIGAALSVLWLDYRIVSAFEGRRWDVPARVYARPLELADGSPVAAARLVAHLDDLGYRSLAGEAPRPGSYFRRGDTLRIMTRPFTFWDGYQAGRAVQVDIADGRVRRIRTADGEPLGVLRLDPKPLGSIVPGVVEDRTILAPGEIPALLRAALIATEDRRFEQHHGVDPKAILRAARANLASGEIRQGGSTLTQQLVKNYFLDGRRTLERKAREAVMAVLLELHYDKEEILTAYVNEVYLGQDGPRAVHGFGLGSRHFFDKPLADLELQELALLVAIVRGPSWYNPWRHPERARERRDRVMDLMAEQGLVSPEVVRAAAAKPLGIRASADGSSRNTPAFLALVRRQLARDYSASDLAQAGLRIFTTLDPMAQSEAERALVVGIRSAESRVGAGDLEGAVIVTHPHTGEVLAAVGGRRSRYEGFNRALDARRPIGSLVKPFVYLTAIETGRYSLATTVADRPVSVELADGSDWAPGNYDGQPHGDVSLMRALAESMNLAAVNTGLDVGVDLVRDRLADLAQGGEVPANPSLLLGAVSYTPLDVAGLYGVLATGGFRTPLRAVLEISDSRGQALERYPLRVEVLAAPHAVDQIVQAMGQSFLRGTARRAGSGVPAAAGKTGTTDEGRDSWFAGFTGDRLAVVWIGRDDNGPTRLTGATGALPVWADLMANLSTTPLGPVRSADLAEVYVDYSSGRLSRADCGDAVAVRLPPSTPLVVEPACDPGRETLVDRGLEWLKRIVP